MINIVPIIFVGGAIAIFSRKRKRRSTKRKALPPANTRGTVFEGNTENRPDAIEAGVGERFSVTMVEAAGDGYSWSLAASPPDNSVTHIGTEYDEAPQPDGLVGGHSGDRVYIFEGAKAGSGALVFHFQAPWLKGKEPPSQIVEILTEIR